VRLKKKRRNEIHMNIKVELDARTDAGVACISGVHVISITDYDGPILATTHWCKKYTVKNKMKSETHHTDCSSSVIT
jgi:hypothetical protein